MSGQDPKFVKGAFAKIADRYVLTNHVLSIGTDILWRRKVGRIVSRWKPEHVLDVATGTGDLALEIQKKCPGAKVLGTDFCPEMLAHATEGGVPLPRTRYVVELVEPPQFIPHDRVQVAVAIEVAKCGVGTFDLVA